MTVYNLPGKESFNVLLTGDPDFVREFAGILDRHQVPFSILPSYDDLDELEAELEMFDPMPVYEGEYDDAYGVHAGRVISDVRVSSGTYTHIVDLSVGVNIDRKVALEFVSTVNPGTTVITSVLSNTATELGMVANVAQRVAGVTLVPGVMSTVATIDMCVGLNTSSVHEERARALLTRIGYTVETVEDRVGLVQIRILAMLINEAAFAVMEGLASPEDIDNAMLLGVNYPKGPLAWADEIGIGIVTLILEGLRREYHQERYRPCVLLKQMLRANWSGKADGRGFYTYT